MASPFPYSHGPHRYTATDARRTLAALGELWAHHAHASHMAHIVCANALQLARDVEHAAGGHSRSERNSDVADPAAALRAAGTLCATRLDALEPTTVSGLLEATWELFSSTRPLAVTHRGRIASLHAGRGLPKPRIDVADVGWRGVAGDVRRARTHHGRPQQALCLWSTDALDVLADEGHPIAAGCAGDNLAIEGIPRSAMRPGARLVAGGVEAFISSYTIPCSKNSSWFAGGDFMRMHHERGDESRLYAMVTAPGRIAVGDDVLLLSDR